MSLYKAPWLFKIKFGQGQNAVTVMSWAMSNGEAP